MINKIIAVIIFKMVVRFEFYYNYPELFFVIKYDCINYNATINPKLTRIIIKVIRYSKAVLFIEYGT